MDRIGFTPGAPAAPSQAGGRRAEEDGMCPLDTTDTAEISGKRDGGGIGPTLPRSYITSLGKVEKSGLPADHVIEATDASFDCIVKCSTTPVLMEFHNPG